MIRGFYTARSGLVAHQENMSVIANNLANVNTNGFKSSRTAFKDLLYQNINRVEAEGEANVGHGVKINKTDILMQGGALTPTGRELDFSIIGDNGFFAVENAYGEIRYTRAGNFSLSNQEDTFYLVDGNGDYVLNPDGETIEIVFDELGNFEILPEDIGVFRFNNPYGLISVNGTNYLETPESGTAEVIENPELKVAYLEASGVEVAVEMVRVIEAQRAFSFNAKMVQTADEIEQIVNSLR